MFIGGGSGSTAGGVKVTTIAVIACPSLLRHEATRRLSRSTAPSPSHPCVLLSPVLVMGATMVVYRRSVDSD